MLFVVLAAVPAEASLQRLAPRVVDVVMVPDGVAGFEGSTVLRVRVLEPGELYAKVLPTPTNPVHDGVQANGTVTADRSAGVLGWWVRFDVARADETGPQTSWGHYADGTATPSVSAPADSEWDVTVTVHAPALAAVTSLGDEVPIVLGLRPDADVGVEGSGASLDDSVVFRLRVIEPPGLAGMAGDDPSDPDAPPRLGQGNQEPVESDSREVIPAGPLAQAVGYAAIAAACLVLIGLAVYGAIAWHRSRTREAQPPSSPTVAQAPPPTPVPPGPAAPAWLRKYRQPSSGLGDRLQRLRRT